MRDIEGGGGCCTIWFKPFPPGVCVCDDDRRERAQGIVSCSELLLLLLAVVVVVKLSQNILLLAPPPQVSDRGRVLRSVWQMEGDGKGGGFWLLSVEG